MILFSQHITNRVSYISDWVGRYLFGQPLKVTSNLLEIDAGEIVINYSDKQIGFPSWQIIPSGLLFETGIQTQDISIPEENKLPVFFQSDGDHPFDILSAVFYLLSRYEEYLPHAKDEYGRYPHVESLAYKNGVLKRPLIDEWMLDLKARLLERFPQLFFVERKFSFLPTYDVDVAWSYKHKGFVRSIGGLLSSVMQVKVSSFAERISVLLNADNDPYDVFDRMDELHKRFGLSPIYFFLLAKKAQGYDKNISPESPAYQALIKTLGKKYRTGIHPSWQAWSSYPDMQWEKNHLDELLGSAVTESRMHYIKFDLPDTFRQLIALGIKTDYSMGYGSINGFRASTCTPFRWYDLTAESPTDLLLVPFSYMEANSIFEQKDSPELALREMQDYHDAVKKVGGTFVSIFHNHLIGLDERGRLWWKMYERFLHQNFPG